MDFRSVALAALLAVGCSTVSASDGRSTAVDVPINGTRVFPESITSDAAGNLYNSSTGGTIYRTLAGTTSAEPWILPDEHNGLTALLGVFVDQGKNMLWACNNPGFGGPPQPGAHSSLKAFDLSTGLLNAEYAFPSGKPIACNDIAVADDGSVWASETSSGGIYVWRPHANELELFAEGQELIGIDGLAFADDGTLYINNVRQNLVQRVNRAEDGSYAGLTNLTLSEPVSGPDGLRSVGGNKFLQAEGSGGRVALIEVDGDSATVTPLKTGLDSSPGVTRVGNVGYATEGKIQYLFNPELRDKDPGPFIIRAFPLPEDL